MSVIDLRSDTVTLPDENMRKAMATAEVGDDVHEEDPTINQLEATVAVLTKKEKALFVTSGTQGNLICAMIYGSAKFPSEIIMGDKAHTNLWEVGGASLIARTAVRTLPTNSDGTISLDILEEHIITENEEDIHVGHTAAVFLENTHNALGGKVLPMAYVRKVRELCDAKKVPLHCDGARSWNAAVALNIPLSEVLAPFDTASICLSKGLGAPVGSMIVGTAAFIAKARKIRKMLGGGMRQAGIVAAGALYAIDNLLPRMHEDHEMAMALYKGISEQLKLPAIEPQSNIVVFTVSDENKKRDVFVKLCDEQGLRLVGWLGTGTVRAVTHYGNTMDDMVRAVTIISETMSKI